MHNISQSLKILIFLTVALVAPLAFVTSQTIEAQPQGGGYICTPSSTQPSDPTNINSIITRARPGVIANDQYFIHTEKELFSCKPTVVPPQPRFNMHTTIITTLVPHTPLSPGSAHFNVMMCRVSLQGDVTSCSTPSIPIMTSNLTRCNETSIQPNPKSSGSSVPNDVWPTGGNHPVPLYSGRVMMSETHEYKCLSGNSQLPNKIKVMTIFTHISPESSVNPQVKVKTYSLETTCVKDIRSARVESCQASIPPS